VALSRNFTGLIDCLVGYSMVLVGVLPIADGTRLVVDLFVSCYRYVS
jgi:hypothetical protein